MFTDLNENTYTDAIKFVAQSKIIKGYSDGTFRPNEPITVAEFCKMIYELGNYRILYCYNKESKLKLSFEEKNIERIFKDSSFVDYLCFIQYFANLNPNLKNDVESIIVNPNKNIDAKQANIILKLIFLFIIPENIYNKLNLNNILNDKSEFNRTKCSILFYEYIKFLFDKIISNNDRGEIKNILSLWDKSPVKAIELVLAFKIYFPQVDDLIKDKSFFRLFKYFYSPKVKSMKDIYCKICEIDDFIDSNMSKFKYSIAYQYTSLTALYQMLSKSNKLDFYDNANITLNMSNVLYLNDPNEGKLYLDIINNNLNNNCYTKDNDIRVKNTYILCLSSDSEERLPMWIQYADGAKGCRIKFEIPSDIEMYKINYCEIKDELPKSIEYLLEKHKKETNDKVKEYIKDKLNEVQYYYKDKYYEHEKEVRYTLNVAPQNALEYDFIRDGEYFPRLYCETPYPFKIKSVMLGPKCPNPEQVALYLKRMGVPRVYKSNIKFQ